MYTLQQISEIVKGELIKGCDVVITEYSIDSRSVVFSEHTLFFALTGKLHNGHDYITSLYMSGVRAFMVEEFRQEYKKLTEANFIIVENVLDSLQQFAAAYRADCKAEIVGITGSNGKTIVKEWLFQLLSPNFHIYRSPRSYNSQVGVPLSILGMDEDAEIAIIEAGISKPGEMERLERMIKPSVGIFTHYGVAHRENFSSDSEQLAEKAKLFQQSDVIIGQSGIAMEQIKLLCPSADYILWGESEDAALKVESLQKQKHRRELILRWRDKKFSITIPFTDEASYENAMNAISYMLYKGVEPQTISERIAHLSAIAMRLEIKEGINNTILVNDFYNSDPSSFQIAIHLSTIQDPAKKQVVILSDFVDNDQSDKQLYAHIAEVVRQTGIDLFIGIGEKMVSNRNLFTTNARFYESTEQFLRFEKREFFKDQVILIKGARPFQFEYIAGFLQKQSHGTILEVNLDAMVSNLNYFRGVTPAKIAVMVKAFSYGSGSREIASILQYNHVDYLMVAFADEGIELRAAGITTPIAVMNPESESFDNMVSFNLEPEIYNLNILYDFEAALQKHGVKNFPVHIKLNTGMNRAGLDEAELPQLIRFFQQPRIACIRSLFSHLAGSDDPKLDQFTLQQINLFQRMSETVQSHFSHKIWRHILNSAGIERFPQYHFDMVRLGIGLHGISAVGTPLTPISRLKTTITSIRNIAAGESVGYGRKSYTTRPSRIAVIPIGYADGLNRKLSNRVGEVYIKGKRLPIIGNISMDSCMIDVTDSDAVIGDEVEIFGLHIPVTEIAAKLETIPYEVLTSVSQRVKRIYFKE